jgi:transposase
LEKRDPEFEPKMAEILCVYRQVAVLREPEQDAAGAGGGIDRRQAIISYDEKPGIQAIGTTGPDLPPLPGRSPTVMRDHEYKRRGTVTLMAGIDVLTGRVHALTKDRHRSREFIEFLKLVDAAYPVDTAIEIILDNPSAHVSRETAAWLATQPPGRFTFTFTPTQGSWLNLIEGFFSKLARSVLRQIRVASKHELRQRLMAFIEDLNREPVPHTWRYKIDKAA